MSARIPFLTLSLLVSFALPLSAQPSGDTAPSLTLAAALARAEAQSPALDSLRQDEVAASARIDQAGVRPAPTLEVSAENFLGTGALQGVRDVETTVSASQTFERGDKREKRVALAGRDRELTVQAWQVRRTEVLSATALAYVELVMAQEQVHLAHEPVALAQAAFTIAETRFKEGGGSGAEIARARSALAIARAAQTRAQASLAGARARLAATWGGTPETAAGASGTLRVPVELPPAETFAAKLEGHPERRLYAALIASREAALELEQAQSTPDLSATGGVRWLRDGSDAALVAGVSLPLPSRARNQASIRAARAGLAGAESGLRATEAGLRARVSSLWHEAHAALVGAQGLRRDALPPAEEAHRLLERAYASGEVSFTDVLEAQRALSTLRHDLLAAETAFILSLARLESLVDPAFPFTSTLLATP